MVNVSVILPVYNCQKYLKHSIQSVLNQDYQDWELIVIDDASTDNSRQEIERLAKENPKIKPVFLSENGGVGKSRNLAMQLAKGRFLAFIDADDLWAKDKLSQQLFFMQKNKVALSHTSYSFMNEKGYVLHSGQVDVDECVNLPRYMKTTQIGMSTVMVDRKYVHDFHFPEDRKLCEDAIVWMSFLRQGQNFYGLNKVLSLYRVRGAQLSQNKAKMAQSTLIRYWNEKNLPAYKRLFYFMHYACNGVRKRCRTTEMDAATMAKFNCNMR